MMLVSETPCPSLCGLCRHNKIRLCDQDGPWPNIAGCSSYQPHENACPECGEDTNGICSICIWSKGDGAE